MDKLRKKWFSEWKKRTNFLRKDKRDKQKNLKTDKKGKK